MAKNNLTITIEDAKLLWPNFEGREGLYNDKGKKNFRVVIDPETAERLLADEWNIKGGGEDDEGNPIQYYLPVAVGFDKFPPRIYLITGENRTQIGEEEVSVLDQIDIKSADMTIRGSMWPPDRQPGQKGGVKAWLRSLFVTIEVDPLDEKYGVWDRGSKTSHDEDDD